MFHIGKEPPRVNLKISKPNSIELEVPDYNPLIENRGRFTVSLLCSRMDVNFWASETLNVVKLNICQWSQNGVSSLAKPYHHELCTDLVEIAIVSRQKATLIVELYFIKNS